MIGHALKTCGSGHKLHTRQHRIFQTLVIGHNSHTGQQCKPYITCSLGHRTYWHYTKDKRESWPWKPLWVNVSLGLGMNQHLPKQVSWNRSTTRRNQPRPCNQHGLYVDHSSLHKCRCLKTLGWPQAKTNRPITLSRFDDLHARQRWVCRTRTTRRLFMWV